MVRRCALQEEKWVVKAKIRKTMDWGNFVLISACYCMPSLCHAATLEGIVNGAARYLTGSVARAIGGLVVIGMGYLTLYSNKFPKETFIMILIGSGMIFGGAEIYKRWVA